MDNLQLNVGDECPWGKWAGQFLAIAFCLMLVCIIFDRDAIKVLNVLSWLTLAVAAITDRQGWRVKQILPVLLTFIFILGCAGASAWFLGDFPAAVHGFVKYQVGVVWFAVLWLAAPIFFHPLWRDRQTPLSLRRAKRWAAGLGVILFLMAFHATLSAAASLFPEDSMELLGSEIIPYVGLVIILKRCSWCMTSQWWRLGARSMWLIIVIASIGMGAVALLALSSPEMADRLFQAGFFRVDSDAPGTRRLQFMFQHHNRAGFFAAIAIFICIAGAWQRRWWRVLGIFAAAAAAFALPFTLTRGALVGAGLGMCLFAVGSLIRFRRLWWVVAAIILCLPLLWFGLPPKYQKHISKIANPDNYHEGTGGSIGARLTMWEMARDMIEKRPELGFGYGFENYESAARYDNPGNPELFHGASHAHNHWLETAAEVGIPGFILLALLTIVRISGLIWATWKGLRSGYQFAWLLLLWLCLEVVIQFYGMTNYTLRRNLGYLTYWIWAGSIVLTMIFIRRQKEDDPDLDLPDGM